MSKRNRNGSFGVEAFYTVTMDNGKSSKSLNTLSDLVVWLDEYVNSEKEENLLRISAINIRKKYRKGVSARLSEVDSELESMNKRLELLTFTRSQLQAQMAATEVSDSPHKGEAM